MLRANEQSHSSSEFKSAKGISLLELKSQTMLSYLVNLSYIILKKCTGQKLEDDPVVFRMCELRTVLEKIRPIELKLKYQIDKLLRSASGQIGENDPLKFRANPDNLITDDRVSDADSGEEVNEERKDKISDVYVPPKLAPMHYDGDLTEKDRQLMRIEKAKKRALSSSIIQELREEYGEEPLEIKESSDFHRITENKEMKERAMYEEENFVRLTLTKKEKSKIKRLENRSNIAGLTKFDDISALDIDAEEMEDDDATPKKRFKKGGGKRGKRGKQGFKKRKR